MHLPLQLKYRKSWLTSLFAVALSFSAGLALAQDNASGKSQSQQKSGSGTKKSAEGSAKSGSKSSTTAKKPDAKNTQTKQASTKQAAAKTAAKVAPAPKVTSYGAVRSHVVYVQDLSSSAVLYSRNDDVPRPIASITKLMTAIVIVDSKLPMSDVIEVTQDDVDTVKRSRSRLAVGTKLTRAEMLHLALMSSENRAANALGRTYPGGLPAFVAAMNAKARDLGMSRSQFVEPTGLSSDNVATPRDLVKLLQASAAREAIHRYTTDQQHEVKFKSGRTTLFRNTNMLVANRDWDIRVSKTGYINEAGQCLVMVARINNRDTAIVLLNAEGKSTRIGDAIRIRQLVQRKELASAPDTVL
jgi:D-alanyl-D-alanine endopeptidase (penicillin-binding protein 7)